MKEKGRFLKKYRGTKCLNCDVPLDTIDKYCHNCGQVNTNKRLSLRDFFDEFFSNIFSYDSRLRHTIITLLSNPGKISKEYIQGKRVKYSNPFRFYLSVSIIFFIINGLFIDFDALSDDVEKDISKGKKTLNELEVNVPIDSLKEQINQGNIVINGISQDKEKINEKISEFENALVLDSTKTGTKHQSKDSTIKVTSFIEKLISGKKVYYTQEQIDESGFFDKGTKLWSMYRHYYKKTGQKSTYKALNALNHKKDRYNRYIYHRVIKTGDMKNNYGQEFFKFIFNKLPFIIFFFLPFLAIGIWLLYIRRSFTYMEHLVFTFHTQTLFFILMGIAMLINKIIGNEIVSTFSYLLFLIYLLLALKRFYNQKWVKTIVKFLLVNVLFFILAGLGTVIIVVGSIFTF